MENNTAMDTRTPEQFEIDRLNSELEHFTKSGIIEIAVRNPSVAEYMAHWEGRALKAEAALTSLEEMIAERRAHYEALIDAGKGEHCKPGYVTDTIWNGWLGRLSAYTSLSRQR